MHKFHGPPMNEFRMGQGRKPVRLIGVNIPFEPKIQFGFLYQADAENHRGEGHLSELAGRKNTAMAQGVKQPASLREQTILRSQLSPELLRQLNHGSGQSSNSGRLVHHDFPRLDSVHAPNHQWQTQTRSTTVAAVAHVSGQQVLSPVRFSG